MQAANEVALRTNLLSLATTRARHVGNDPNVERYDPDLWNDEFAFLSRPGQAEIQSDLFYDYRTNVETYPEVASMDAGEAAASAGDLGEVRPLVRPRRTGAVPTGCTDR
jgi:hypothetical protein